jgi:hypothetical protein
VERILLDSNGRASGIALRGGGSIKARKAVVSNASVWDTVRLLPPDLPAAQAAVSTFNRYVQRALHCSDVQCFAQRSCAVAHSWLSLFLLTGQPSWLSAMLSMLLWHVMPYELLV